MIILIRRPGYQAKKCCKSNIYFLGLIFLQLVLSFFKYITSDFCILTLIIEYHTTRSYRCSSNKSIRLQLWLSVAPFLLHPTLNVFFVLYQRDKSVTWTIRRNTNNGWEREKIEAELSITEYIVFINKILCCIWVGYQNIYLHIELCKYHT